MPTFFRSDGWVKAVTGQAVPGAQIYVCTQPANDAFAPPTPLVSIYSDVSGLVPITQPLLTDGFGHYDFYVLPGTYTVVVCIGNVIQQIYTDQSIGVAGGGGSVTSVGITDSTGIFSITGSPVTSSGSIGIAFANEVAKTALMGPSSGPAAAPSFRQPAFGDLSGNIAVSQMASGSGASSSTFWRGDGSWASAGGVNLSTAGQGGFFGPGLFVDGSQMDQISVQSARVCSAANQVRVTQFVLTNAITIRKVSTAVSNNVAAQTITFGLYDMSGNKLLDSGTFAIQTAPAVQANTLGSPVALSPGVYWLAQSATTNSGCTVMGLQPASDSNNGQIMFNTNSTRYGTAANSSTAGVLPATLGVITSALPTTDTVGVACPFFEP